MDLKQGTKIYIIESPSSSDIDDDRKEGHALSAILKLAGINNSYTEVNTIKSLAQCFDDLYEDAIKHKGTFVALYIHFSMHGNKDGIALTSNEFVNWHGLYLLIDNLGRKLGRTVLYDSPKIEIAPINLLFSVCDGFAAKIMREYNNLQFPYIYLVGPTEKVNWSDSLIAFATYYHITLHKEYGNKKAVLAMNTSAGLDEVFQLDMPPFLSHKE